MKFQFFAYFLSIVSCLCCSDFSGKTKPVQNKIENKSVIKIKPSSSFSDTIKINSTAAVFYAPDSLQLERMRSYTDAKIFEGSMHEYYSLIQNAHLVIKKYYPRLKIIEVKNARYLLFTGSDKKAVCIDLDKVYDPFGLFVFNGQKTSALLDMANIETELGFYFPK